LEVGLVVLDGGEGECPPYSRRSRGRWM